MSPSITGDTLQKFLDGAAAWPLVTGPGTSRPSAYRNEGLCPACPRCRLQAAQPFALASRYPPERCPPTRLPPAFFNSPRPRRDAELVAASPRCPKLPLLPDDQDTSPLLRAARAAPAIPCDGYRLNFWGQTEADIVTGKAIRPRSVVHDGHQHRRQHRLQVSPLLGDSRSEQDLTSTYVSVEFARPPLALRAGMSPIDIQRRSRVHCSTCGAPFDRRQADSFADAYAHVEDDV